jgi:hypothetical protein
LISPATRRSLASRLALALLVGALTALAARPASAAPDAAVRAEVQRVLARDYARADFTGAQKKLVVSLQRCGRGCSAGTRAQIWMALGLVSLQLAQLDEAAKRFASAVREDPDARLPTAKGGRDVSRDAQSLLDEARHPAAEVASASEPAPAPDGPAEAPTPAADAARPDDGVRAPHAVAGALGPRAPQVTFVRPQGVSDLEVTLDGNAIPPEDVSKRTPLEPGKHTVHAEGTIHDVPMVFDKSFEAQEGETVGVTILLAPQRPEYLTTGQIKCMLSAKSQEDLLACLPQEHRQLAIRAGLETSGYTDTTHVNVGSPEIHASVSAPTAGWNASGSYLVDVVSAASPDIVSEASPPFHEIRQAGTLGGGYKGGPFGIQAGADVSSEPDYLSLGGGVSLTADLNSKLITPSVGYNYSHDTIGRSTTPFSVFHHDFETNGFEAGTTFVMSPTSILLLSGTLDLERGDQSKPYRYIPLFAPSVAPTVTPGASVAQVNEARLPARPLEQLPLARNRYAVGARFAHRFGSSTLRVEQRVYTDSWQLSASTTDLRWLTDAARWLRVGLHGRFNAQGGASFYRLAYSAAIDPSGHLAVPALRTDDRELSPLVTLTGGPGLRLNLGAGGKVEYGLELQADVMYTRYFNALFVTERTAVYGTVGFEAVLE